MEQTALTWKSSDAFNRPSCAAFQLNSSRASSAACNCARNLFDI